MSDIVIVLSDYISSGGEPTTAQLTAPSGKTTSDFEAGWILDDQNPANSIDLSEDAYTELEWSLVGLTAGLYQLRLTNNGISLDGYDEYAEITITEGELSVQSASHTQNADNVLLSGIDLIVSNCSHSQTADNIILSGIDLAVSDCIHVVTSDNVSLVVNLVVSNCTHNQTADNIVLTNSLTVQDCTHVHTADNVILVSNFAGNVAARTTLNMSIGITI